MHRYFVCWVLSLFIGVLAGCEEKLSPSQVQAKQSSYSTHMRSKYTAQSYPIHVYLPPSYAQSPQKKFPVVYVTDGQWFFAMCKEMLQKRNLQVILVGIEEGADNRRQVDYSLPGATAYRQFLTLELLPFIEANYRINPAWRTLAGSSLGGALVGLNMLYDSQETQYFHNYWAVDGSFALFKEPAYQAVLNQNSSVQLQGQAFFSGSSGGNNSSVEEFLAIIRGRFNQLTVEKITLQVPHQDAVVPSFEAAINAYQPEP